MVGTNPWKKPLMPRSRKIMPEPCRKPRMRGLPDFRSSILCTWRKSVFGNASVLAGQTYSVVFILSNGVTANKDSVIPAPKPAITVLGPDILPNSSCSNVLYVSKATKPNNTLVNWPPILRSNTHTNSSFERIPDDQRRTSCIPCLSERRPSKLLPVW